MRFPKRLTKVKMGHMFLAASDWEDVRGIVVKITMLGLLAVTMISNKIEPIISPL